jgi:hypothetical protein
MNTKSRTTGAYGTCLSRPRMISFRSDLGGTSSGFVCHVDIFPVPGTDLSLPVTISPVGLSSKHTALLG